MTRTGLALVAVLLSVSVAEARQPPDVIEVPQAVGEAITRSAVGVHYLGGGGTHYGSGIVLPNGDVLTAAHVLGCTDEVFVQALAEQRRHRARVVAIDDGYDLALLHIDLPKRSSLVGVALGPAQPRRGERVFGWGRSTSIAAGQVTSGATSELTARIPLRPGDSGGPLFDAQGRLVGVLSRGSIERVDAWFVPLAEVRAFLDGADRGAALSERDLCSRSRQGWADLRDAHRQRDAGQLGTALLRLEQALAKEPAPGLRSRVRETRAMILAGLDRPDEALVELDLALAETPGVLSLLRRRLWVLVELKRWGEAEPVGEQLLALDPGDAEIWTMWSHAAARAGHREEARRALDAHVAAADGHARGEALAVRCAVAFARGEDSAAMEDCGAALGLGFELTWMHDKMAASSDRAGGHADAVTSYLRSLALGSGRPDTARRAARLLVALGRDAEALEVLAGFPLEEDDLWTAIVACARSGLTDAAAKHLARALEVAVQRERFVAIAEHLAAGGRLGAATEGGAVELVRGD